MAWGVAWKQCPQQICPSVSEQCPVCPVDPPPPPPPLPPPPGLRLPLQFPMFTMISLGVLAVGFFGSRVKRKRGGAQPIASRFELVAYHLDNFFSTSPYASGLLLCAITACLITIGGARSHPSAARRPHRRAHPLMYRRALACLQGWRTGRRSALRATCCHRCGRHGALCLTEVTTMRG